MAGMRTLAFMSLWVIGLAVTPMEKVMTMLFDVQMKLVEDGKTSELAFANYSKFCSHGQRDLGYDIKDGEKTVEQLTATIAKTSSEIDVSTSKLQELQSAIGKSEADLTQAQEMREKEHQEHQNAHGELGEATEMLGRAIKTLSAKVSPSLLQQKVDGDVLLKALGAVVDAASIPNKERESLMSFVEAQNYISPKSQNIVSTLEDMKMKAREELNTMAVAEKQSLHSFMMLKQPLEMQISADQKEMDQAKLLKATAQQEKAMAEADLEGTQKDLANDQESLKKLELSCSQATRDYEDSSKSRAEEMEALKKAEKVLAEKTGATIKSAAFLQISGDDLGLGSVVQIMRSLAKKTPTDHGMETFAENVESLMQTHDDNAAPGVFEKVKDMIENMIASKKKEAASEQTKKAYCDEEQSKTKAKLEELSSKKDTLGAKVDKKTSESETLKREALTLQKELGELSELQVEMDERRQEEEVAFKKQKLDLQSGLEGVRSAISVLRDYYATSGAASGSGIVSMLEVIESDFGRSLAQAESIESSRAEEHDSMTKQNKLTEVQKAADQKFKSKTSSDLEKAVLDLSADSETTQEELAAVLTYQESLAKQCFDGGMSYEERNAQREEEIKGLKEALAALSTESPVLLQGQLRGVKPHRSG